MEESININNKYKRSGIIKSGSVKTKSNVESIVKKTKSVGNQNVILAAEGCHLFKIGRTSPNFFTWI